MIRLLAVLLFSWIVLQPAAALAEPGCTIPGFRLYPDQTAPGFMYATSGRPCTVTLAYSGGPTHSVQIVSAPKNGTVTISGHRIRYTSRAGFTGKDTFSYMRKGLTTVNKPVSYTVEMTVDVAAQR